MDKILAWVRNVLEGSPKSIYEDSAYANVISLERQRWLTTRLFIEPDIQRGIFPFSGQKLERADVIWLLEAQGLVANLNDLSVMDEQNICGLDLRGADLRKVDLSNLPLAYTVGSLQSTDWHTATPEQRQQAVVHLEHTQLRGTDLSGSYLCGARFEKSHLIGANLARAELVEAHLEFANLSKAHLEGADLRRASLYAASFEDAHLEHYQNGHFYPTYLDGAFFAFTSFRNADLNGAIIRWAQLSGATFLDAQLTGVDFEGSNFAGRKLTKQEFEWLSSWEKDFIQEIPPTDLRFAKFDEMTRLGRAKFGDPVNGFASIRGIKWGGINLTNVDWLGINELGDEREARLQRQSNRKFRREQKILSARNPVRLIVAHARALRPSRRTRYSRWIAWMKRNKTQANQILGTASKSTERDTYRNAVQAHRQLASELRSQGMNDEANEFSFRAQYLQRAVLWRENRLGAWVLSLILDVVTGYGYRLSRAFGCYAAVIVFFTVLFYAFGNGPFPQLDRIDVIDALATSMNAFHGRGVSAAELRAGDPREIVGAFEAFVGMLVELALLTTLGQRFFGK